MRRQGVGRWRGSVSENGHCSMKRKATRISERRFVRFTRAKAAGPYLVHHVINLIFAHALHTD